MGPSTRHRQGNSSGERKLPISTHATAERCVAISRATAPPKDAPPTIQGQPGSTIRARRAAYPGSVSPGKGSVHLGTTRFGNRARCAANSRSSVARPLNSTMGISSFITELPVAPGAASLGQITLTTGQGFAPSCRKTLPGIAPVCWPRSRTTWPLTRTYSIPSL